MKNVQNRPKTTNQIIIGGINLVQFLKKMQNMVKSAKAHVRYQKTHEFHGLEMCCFSVKWHRQIAPAPSGFFRVDWKTSPRIVLSASAAWSAGGLMVV
jgi:hypothetical protein